MCIKVVERYAVCRCIYFSHPVDVCPAYGRRGHYIKTHEVLVGYGCSRHAVNPNSRWFNDSAIDLSTRSTESTADNARDDQEDRLQGANSETAIESPLRIRLLAKLEKVFDTEEHFIPAGDLEQVLTSHDIEAELQTHGLEDLNSFVSQRAKRVFAILLVIRKLDALQDLFKEDLGDELLPVAQSALESLSDKRLRAAFSKWDLNTRKGFCDFQWTVLVPVFSEAEHLMLDDNARLPFIETGRIASGAFGSVHRVQIHHDHEKFKKLGSPTSEKVRLRSQSDHCANNDR